MATIKDLLKALKFPVGDGVFGNMSQKDIWEKIGTEEIHELLEEKGISDTEEFIKKWIEENPYENIK